MKNVLFIIPGLNAGGTENYVQRFIKYYQGQMNFHVLSLSYQKGDLYQEFIAAGAYIHYQSLGYINPIKGWKLYQIIKKNRIESICAFNGNFGGWALCIAWLAGVKNRLIFYRRSTPAFQQTFFKKTYHKMMGYFVRVFAKHILSNSEFAFYNFHPIYYGKDSRFQVIYNGVDTSLVSAPESKEFYRTKFNIPQETFVIGHVGRYDPAKNHETIFKVAQILKREKYKVHFLFCGKDTDSLAFKRELEKYQIVDITSCLGLQNQIAEVYKCMDVFFFPSHTEGQPNALIEAVLAGVPIVASNISPIVSIISNPYQKYLVDANDELKFYELITNLFTYKDFDVNGLRKLYFERFDVKVNFETFKRHL